MNIQAFVFHYKFLISTAALVGTLPPDFADQIVSMQKAIDKLSAEMASVSHLMQVLSATFCLCLLVDISVGTPRGGQAA